MSNYISDNKADLDRLYIQKGTIIFYDLPMQSMLSGQYVDITAQWLDTLDCWITDLRSRFEAGNNPKHQTASE